MGSDDVAPTPPRLDGIARSQRVEDPSHCITRRSIPRLQYVEEHDNTAETQARYANSVCVRSATHKTKRYYTAPPNLHTDGYTQIRSRHGTVSNALTACSSVLQSQRQE